MTITISDILDLGSLDKQGTQPKPTIGKKFWSYVRAQKKNTVGIPLLKVGQRDITDSVKKAEVLSNQYESVFTDENPTAMPMMTRPRIEGNRQSSNYNQWSQKPAYEPKS